MNHSSTSQLFLTLLFILLSGLNTSAQQPKTESSPQSDFLVEVTGSGLYPFTLPVYESGAFKTTWSGDIPRIANWEPNDEGKRGLNIPIKIVKEGDGARIEIRVGLESFKEVAVASYDIHVDEKIVISEVAQYGFKPFTAKLRATEIKQPILIPPRSDLPEVENSLKSIDVVGVEKGEATDEYLLTLRNIGAKNIIALEVSMPSGGISEEQTLLNSSLIPAGAIYNMTFSAQTAGRTTDEGFIPDSVQPKCVINAVLFDDYSYQGDFVSAAKMEARRRGNKLQLQRGVALLERALESEDEAQAVLENIEQEIYSLGVKEGADIMKEVKRHYPPLGDNLEQVMQGLKSGLATFKYDLINKLKAYQEGQRSIGRDDLRAWLKNTKEHYESLLSVLCETNPSLH